MLGAVGVPILSSEQNGVKVSKKQIASAANVNERTVGRYCNLITKAIPNDLQVLASVGWKTSGREPSNT